MINDIDIKMEEKLGNKKNFFLGGGEASTSLLVC